MRARTASHNLKLTLAMLTLLAGLLLLAPPALGQIQGSLSNFDVESEGNPSPMTNLELDLRGIGSWQLGRSFYQGPGAWGIPPAFRDIAGTELVWADLRNPIPPGGIRHFGFGLAVPTERGANSPPVPAPCGVQAHWTRHTKVVELPVPWQSWRAEAPDRVIDVVRLTPGFPEPVVIDRQFATAQAGIPLDLLTWDMSLPAGWTQVPGDPTVLAPGASVELPIQLAQGDQAVFVRYTVALARNPGNILTRFVNEAEIGLPRPPVISGWLSNFDVRNDTGRPVHDLELELLNVQPVEVLDWYRGPSAWGLHPVSLDPLIRSVPGGTEAIWADEWNPLPLGETRHFGLRLSPAAQPPSVRAWWTRTTKFAPLPVPWQWWELKPGGIVRDVIQLSDTFEGRAAVIRQWALAGAAIPIDELVWDNPSIVWNPDPAGRIELGPGEQTSLDIQLTGSEEAVLVRYTVERVGGSANPETRFVNEVLVTSGYPGHITGQLVNFDAVNLTGEPVTNLEMDLRGLDPYMFWNWYRGALAWGLHPIDLIPARWRVDEAEVAWADFRSPVQPGEVRHFGLDFTGSVAPVTAQAWWTQHRKVVEIPVPWQTWLPAQDLVSDIIRLSPDSPGSVLVRRETARMQTRVPLDELNWDAPDIPWEPVATDPVSLPPGGTLSLPIPVDPLDRAVLVRYEVAPAGLPAQTITRFVNEAEIEVQPGLPPSIVGTLSNFDVLNDSGKQVHDLELDILGIAPGMILDWYEGPMAWGIPPVIRPLDAGGSEVTWIDDLSPLEAGEIRHFGLRLAPGAPEPSVRAFWTREVRKVRIPVPWQFWLSPPGPFIRDVIALSDTHRGQMLVEREFAATDRPVALDRLNWNLALPWQPDPAGQQVLSPGFQLDLDIPFDPNRDAAVLVRYTVTPLPGNQEVVRFVNEALLGPGVVTGLRFATKDDIVWDLSPLQWALYDMVRGQAATLRVNDGLLDAVCIANDLLNPTSHDPARPAAGEGFYYVARIATWEGGHGTYDSTMDPARREGRDDEIGADCP